MEEGEDGLLSLACTKCGNQFKENGGCQGLRKANGDKDQIQQIMAGMGEMMAGIDDLLHACCTAAVHLLHAPLSSLSHWQVK